MNPGPAVTPLYGRVLFSCAAATLLLCQNSVTIASHAAPGEGGRGRIEGVVRLVAPTWTAVQGGAYATRRVSRPAPRPAEIHHVVVYVKDAPADPEMPRSSATIVQTNEAFVPRVVAITRGSTVEFPNADPFFHNVFSLSRGASFDLGRYPRGETRTRRFPSAGLVKVYCHIHSHMTASIMVFDHPYFRVPEADGSFAIEHVPAGTHEVSAWHERIGESSSRVHLEPGRTARVEFALPVDPRP